MCMLFSAQNRSEPLEKERMPQHDCIWQAMLPRPASRDNLVWRSPEQRQLVTSHSVADDFVVQVAYNKRRVQGRCNTR